MKELKVNRTKPKRAYLDLNVILTFESFDQFGGTQEFFDLKIPISKSEISASDFCNKKLFPSIAKYCNSVDRKIGDLIKISTSSNWNEFREHTDLDSDEINEINGKWYFGLNRTDLSNWELDLMSKYKFGVVADMSSC